MKRPTRDALPDRPPIARWSDGILVEEKDAVIAYALAHPKDGYRRLAWQMVDADVAYLSPSSVYRVLLEADLLSRWKRSQSSGTKPAVSRRMAVAAWMRRSDQPSRPNARTCRCLWSLKTLLMSGEGPRGLRRRQRLGALSAVAGSQPPISGRFWVSTEGAKRPPE